MTYTFDDSIVSDLHKDACGFRPTQMFWHSWDASTDDEKQKIWDCLIVEAEDRANRERKMEDAALTAFEVRIAQGIATGAENRTQAIRWILQAEGLEDERDAGYICYKLGLSYSCEKMFAEAVSLVRSEGII